MISEGSILETDRPNEGRDYFELDFMKRETAPEQPMKFGILLHLAFSFILYTVFIIYAVLNRQTAPG